MLETTDDIVTFYQSYYQQHGATALGMAWASIQDHYIRTMMAKRLLDAMNIPFNRILDVGCGVGQLPLMWDISYGQLKRTIYHGVDPVPEYIRDARETNSHHPSNPNVVFTESTFQDFVVTEPYAITVALGTIAFQPAWAAQAILHKMWESTYMGGAMVFTYINGSPLDDGQVRMMARVLPEVHEVLEYRGYTKTGERMMIFHKTPLAIHNKHLEELEDEVARGEHREDDS